MSLVNLFYFQSNETAPFSSSLSLHRNGLIAVIKILTWNTPVLMGGALIRLYITAPSPHSYNLSLQYKLEGFIQ